MSAHPNAPQGSAGRAEELRGLSDFNLAYRLGELDQQKRQDTDAFDLAEIDAERDSLLSEWFRRRVKRDAQEAELERLRESEEQLLGELREIVGAANGDDGPPWEEFSQGDALEASKAQEVELERLREAARRAVFEGLTKHHATPKLIPSEKLRERLVDLDALLKPQPQEASEVVGIDLARTGSDDMNAVAVRNPDGTVRVELEEAREGQETPND